MKRASARQKSTRPRLRRPIIAAGVVLVIYIIFMLIKRSSVLIELQMLGDLLLCGLAAIFWVFFFAQFTLPLHDNRKRFGAFVRLFSYVLGMAGPAVRVEDGKALERKGESERSGPGVILLDTASAAMIRNPAEFKGAVGPGVAFTERHESLSATIDLHRVKGGIGPDEKEDPFLPPQNGESEGAFKAREARRFATQGLTGNGIEIVPRIQVIARLDTSSHDGGTRFGYSKSAVERAIRNMPVDKLDTETGVRKIEITALPLQLAADIWKECISRGTLEELFTFQPGQATLLQRITAEMRARLTQPTYFRTDASGKPIGQRLGSKEYSILNNRGIEVVAVSIPFIKMRKEIEARLVEVWLSNWMTRAQGEKDFVEQLRGKQVEQGKQRAIVDYASGISRTLGAQNPALRMTGEQILRQLLRGSLTMINRDPGVQRHASDEIDQLKELLEWSEKRSETA